MAGLALRSLSKQPDSRYAAVLTSSASSLVWVKLAVSPSCSKTSPFSEAMSTSDGSPSKCSGTCLPLLALYFSVYVNSILSAVTGTRTEPVTVTGTPPTQRYSMKVPALPTG